MTRSPEWSGTAAAARDPVRRFTGARLGYRAPPYASASTSTGSPVRMASAMGIGASRSKW